jgi:hypothetical protein
MPQDAEPSIDAGRDPHAGRRRSLLGTLRLVRKTFLTNSWRIYNSQYGEDCVLRELPEVRGARPGFYVDVGCWHPRKFSNTHILHKKGWVGLNVDDDKVFCFRLARPSSENVRAAVSDRAGTAPVYRNRGFSIWTTLDPRHAAGEPERRVVRTRTLTEILDASRFRDRPIDVLDIDVEGLDLRVLSGLDFSRYRPRLVLVELRARRLDAVVGSDVHRFMTEHGYGLINWVGLTLFYRSATPPEAPPPRPNPR